VRTPRRRARGDHGDADGLCDADRRHGLRRFPADRNSALLLARALYKQPMLLFLDEATSHLDVQRESIVNAGVRDLKLTRVIVAHRPQTIASADRVIVLEGGSIRQDLRVAAADGTSPPSAPAPAASFRRKLRAAGPVMAESSGPAS